MLENLLVIGFSIALGGVVLWALSAAWTALVFYVSMRQNRRDK